MLGHVGACGGPLGLHGRREKIQQTIFCWDFFDGYLEAMLGHAGIMFGSCWIKNVSRHLVNLYTESCFFWSFSFLFVLILNRTKQWKSDESWQDAVLYLPGNLCDEFASRGIVPDGGLTVVFLELAGI